MCITYPGRIKAINKDDYVVQYGPQQVRVPNSLVDDVEEGDWVIVENKFITRKLTDKQAEEFYKIISNKK
ncbi:MAG: HypC/HybG/HupF family hydrogenase formation chaperone [Patescibacteria group bacterium]